MDSLEPQYDCPSGSQLFKAIQSDSNAAWQQHLDQAADLFRVLDDISGVSPADSDFHASTDHYYDNLSARQCHGKPFPCKLVDGVNTSLCMTQELANRVYRLGNWEYSQIYRDNSSSLDASAATFGIWIGELAWRLRQSLNGQSPVVYYHNIAHDGSLSRLLSILQIDKMVWPGMGAEVVFELYRNKPSRSQETCTSSNSECSSSAIETAQPTSRQPQNRSNSDHKHYYVRILWGGRVLKSSSPFLGRADMIPANTLLQYFDDLVGKRASKVRGICEGK